MTGAGMPAALKTVGQQTGYLIAEHLDRLMRGDRLKKRIFTSTPTHIVTRRSTDVAVIPAGLRKTLSVEHPTGEMSCVLELDDQGTVLSVALLRTARKLMDGVVFG